jgi:nucleoid-associated protein YgaU
VTPPGFDPAPPAGPTPDKAKVTADWASLLRADDVTSLMSPVRSQTPDTSGGAVKTPLVDVMPTPEKHSEPTVGETPSAPDNVPAAPAASSSYVVKSGDTLSSIARSAYGDARLYKKILEANPKINPNRMRTGITITLPGKSQMSRDTAITDASIPTTPTRRSSPKSATLISVNSATEYRVVSNDNLYRISMKLYNTPNKVDLIYQFNKDLIGADPAKLKLNMVLKLPEPPTQTASTR